MAFPSSNGFGPLWSSETPSEPLKVAVEGHPKGRSEAAALNPIGPPSSAAVHFDGAEPEVEASRLAASAPEDKGSLERRVVALEEENRMLRAALASLREIGTSVLRSLTVDNPQASDHAGTAAPAAAAAGKPAPVVPALPDTGPAKAAVTSVAAESQTPVTFSFSIRKADNTDLGLDVASERNQPGLLVEAILPGGAAEAWNKQQDPGSSSARDLRPGDTILRVNAAEDPEIMLKECRNKQLLKLVVRRAASTEKPPAAPEPAPEKVVTYSPALTATTADSERTPPATAWSSPMWLPTPACLDERPASASANRRVLVI
ncbi:unnamed protein product [Symbiodinium natans]|uniref:PDZ domain-containing protein n=1 Tax=Symbiodinium natans TaxID=878477 RepID=A0A812MWE7_9DINO|nr:unnamed protein product [Symbiodinium natans]